MWRRCNVLLSVVDSSTLRYILQSVLGSLLNANAGGVNAISIFLCGFICIQLRCCDGPLTDSNETIPVLEVLET
jgi:hypothetical protein